jgi:8-oxo-dGTP diphosphatase
MVTDFHGAKAAIYLGGDLLIYQRDDQGAWPGMWDFPGGGRKGDESPLACLRREIWEEFGLIIPERDVRWQRAFPAMADPAQSAWFFVVMRRAEVARQIRFGSEGQRWALMDPHDVANLPNLIPALRDRLTLWLRESGSVPI